MVPFLRPYSTYGTGGEHATFSYGFKTILQGSRWPKDRPFLCLVRDCANTLLKRGKLEDAVQMFDTLAKACQDLFGNEDDMTVWAETNLEGIRDRKKAYADAEARAISAAQGQKLRPGLPRRPTVDSEACHEEVQSTAVEERSQHIPGLQTSGNNQTIARSSFQAESPGDLLLMKGDSIEIIK